MTSYLCKMFSYNLLEIYQKLSKRLVPTGSGVDLICQIYARLMLSYLNDILRMHSDLGRDGS